MDKSSGAYLLAFGPWVIFIILSIVLLIFVYKMAKKRGRSGGGWVFLSLFISPLLSMIILACLGETEERRTNRIIQEEELREGIRRRQNITQ